MGGGGGNGFEATGSQGSGSGSSDSDSGSIGSPPPNPFETEEYQANFGLDAIGASSAYAAGATGHGITVGVIDTGIDVDHPEFEGAIAPASIDIVTSSAEWLDDEDGHGTAVAGIIAARKNNSLGHGVAFESTVLAIRADADGSCAFGCTFDEADVADATDYAVLNGADVINYSLGGGNSLGSALAHSMETAVDSGAILVLAAGNAGEPEPTFPARFAIDPRADGQVIVAGAVDADDQIASFSNRAGSASDSFLVAPGIGILTTGLNGGSAPATGTSFATAHVSGAAALVLQISPFLTPAQVVELLLSTATDLGNPGPDSVYGRGLVNVGAALSPQGTLSVPVGEMVKDGRPLVGSGLRLGSAFGAGPTLGRAIFLDGYGRPYSFDLDDLIRTPGVARDLLAWLAPDRFQSHLSASLSSDLRLNVLVGGLDDTGSWTAARDRIENDEPSFALSADVGSTGRLSFSHGLGLQGQFGLATVPAEPIDTLLSGDRLTSPYLAFTDEADSLVVDQELSGSLALRLGLASRQPQRQGELERGRTKMIVGEIARRWSSGSHLGVQFGNMEETDSVLDSAGGGALGLPSTSTTSFLGLNGRLALSERFALVGQASFGLTDPGSVENSLITEMSPVRSFGFGAALAGRNLLASSDRLTIAASQPLRVYSGYAVVRRPIGRTVEGRVIGRNDTVDLEPNGRELDLELGYSLPLGRKRKLSFNWLTQLEPGHDRSASPIHTLALRLKAEF